MTLTTDYDTVSVETEVSDDDWFPDDERDKPYECQRCAAVVRPSDDHEGAGSVYCNGINEEEFRAAWRRG